MIQEHTQEEKDLVPRTFRLKREIDERLQERTRRYGDKQRIVNAALEKWLDETEPELKAS